MAEPFEIEEVWHVCGGFFAPVSIYSNNFAFESLNMDDQHNLESNLSPT